MMSDQQVSSRRILRVEIGLYNLSEERLVHEVCSVQYSLLYAQGRRYENDESLVDVRYLCLI